MLENPMVKAEYDALEVENRPFVAAPTAEPETEFWHPEVMQAEIGESQGTRRIGGDENWIELSWNLSQRWVWLALYTTMDDLPLELWHHRITLPDMPHEAHVDLIRHFTHLANLLYSLYVASADVTNLIPELMDPLLSFRRFLEGLVD